MINPKNITTFAKEGKESNNVLTSIFIPFTLLMLRKGRSIRIALTALTLVPPGKKLIILF